MGEDAEVADCVMFQSLWRCWIETAWSQGHHLCIHTCVGRVLVGEQRLLSVADDALVTWSVASALIDKHLREAWPGGAGDCQVPPR